MKALVVHPGTQLSFRIARQLERHGCLSRFWTGFAYVPGSLLEYCIRCLPASLRRIVSSRRLTGVPSRKLRTRPLIEGRAMFRLRSGQDEQAVMFDRNTAFQRQVPRRELAMSDVVIGFDTSSWILADRAAALDRPFILDQSIGHSLSYQMIFPMLQRQFPEWGEDLPVRLPQVSAAEKSEHANAHRVVAASSFTRRTLVENGVAAEKIVVNPYGVDLGAFSPVPRPDKSRPLRFVFLGILGARKGLPLLLQAWRSLSEKLSSKNAELWLVGPLNPRHASLIPPLSGLKVIGKVPHSELPGLLRQCDVLVFPSYFEGFGLVLLEAMAAGLPIIATDATAAPDLITNGVEGYVIPVGDVDALRQALERFILSPADLTRMSPAARQCAERYSWDAYGDRWVNMLQQVV
jgi:glycosyltransferase involved in cell wall biosynthesis